MKFGLKEESLERIRAVFSKYPQIEKVILYGSRAKGNYKNGSDIDLTLKGKGLHLDIVNRLSLELDDLLLPYTFDLSVYRQIGNSDLIAHIERAGLVFYETAAASTGSPTDK